VFFYLSNVYFIKNTGNITKIITKPSKKQNTKSNDCITAIENAIPNCSAAIKDWAIDPILVFLLKVNHSINPFVVTVTFSTSTLSRQYGSACAQSKAALRLLKSMVRNGE
jgi:hypothetical protein